MKTANYLKLTEDEKKYLCKYEKMVERIYMNYIMVGILFCIVLLGLFIGIVLKRKEGFLMAIIFMGFGATLLVVSQKYQKLYKIISKMKQQIIESGKQE